MKDNKNIKSFGEFNENLNISDVIKRLETDDSEIKFGDYFLEVGEYNFIHILKDFSDGDEGYNDYELPNGIEVIPFSISDLEWNKKMTNYKRIVNVL